jgi:hypothetical protein
MFDNMTDSANGLCFHMEALKPLAACPCTGFFVSAIEFRIRNIMEECPEFDDEQVSAFFFLGDPFSGFPDSVDMPPIMTGTFA